MVWTKLYKKFVLSTKVVTSKTFWYTEVPRLLPLFHSFPVTLSQQIRMLAKINHSNIVQFYGACTKQPNCFIVVEYLSLGDLNRHIYMPGASPLSWTIRFHCAKDIALAVEFLHCNNVIHRDLNLQNVLVASLDRSTDSVLCKVIELCVLSQALFSLWLILWCLVVLCCM